MPYMPYEPDQGSDNSHGSRSEQREGSMTVSGSEPPRREEPRGIHRYFQPQTRPSQLQTPRPAVPPPSLPSQFSWTPSSGPPRTSSSRPRTPATPTLTRTPSRIAVVINSASAQQTSAQPVSRDASEDSMEGFIVTSDINPRRRGAPAPAPAPAPVPSPATLQPSPMKPSSATPKPRGRPPGRPPGSTNKTNTSTPRAKPSSSTTPRTVIPTTTTTQPTTQTPTTQPTVKRRGRPVGWRPGMGSYAALTTDGTPAPPKSSTKDKGPPKKRGRPAGRPGVKPTRAIWEKLNPTYFPFICEWAGCPAELQNINTLRQHVRVIHGHEGEEVGCRWGKCNAQVKTLQLETTNGRMFDSEKEFLRHMEERHLVPLVWHVGDGPRNTVMEYKVKTEDEEADELPAYLFDEEGNQVTPSVLGQVLESEEERKARRTRLRRRLLQRERNAPVEAGSDEEDGMNDADVLYQ
ncbi:hypothetical protein GE09DRAFT_268651 [Coniochaeta sp. 2T2.1]|nr:hypothetical protein GE09DRAFT_268651 [Coniochaeta sp. 2T2.1]